jgi:hypothetical protein
MYYTTRQRGDGFGGIFQNVIFDALYAHDHGHIYVYTPQNKMEHNYTNDPDFNDRLFKFLNLQSIFPKPDHMHINEYSYGDVYPYVEQHLDRLYTSSVMKSIKDAFYENKYSPYDVNKFHVAVHIRRPNPHDSRVDGTDTPNSYYIRHMEHIKKTYTGEKPLEFHIYSQGNLDMFNDFRQFNPIFHINDSLEDTFLGFVYADILVISRSSMSYSAALITNGIVYYNPFWHPPLKHWHTI